MSNQQKRGPGRPRKWASDAERKRAYRARKAAELAEPHRILEEARSAIEEAAAARSELETARRAVQRAEQRVLAAQRRSDKLAERVRATEAAARRARMTRDRAEILLKQRVGVAKDAQRLRDDPDALIALVADQRRLLDWYRRRVRELEQGL